MDNRIRKNDICIINQPRCDYVFSSTRACFIAYGFADSTLEMQILRNILKERGIEAYEAGTNIAPGQQIFCAKICSKIITAQFCIVLLNHAVDGSTVIPNANVNMEYGLMLGFNKYVIPFQKEDQKLPFNVAGLDTVKYNSQNFMRLAENAIDAAIKATQQTKPSVTDTDQKLAVFLLANDCVVTPLSAQGDRDIFELGKPLGYNLLTDFSGFVYRYFGNFTSLNTEEVLWRIEKLNSIMSARFGTLDQRIAIGMISHQHAQFAKEFIASMEIWVLVTGDSAKADIEKWYQQQKSTNPVKIYTLADVDKVAEERSVIRPTQFTGP